MKVFFITLFFFLSGTVWADQCHISENSQLIVNHQLNRTAKGLDELAQWKQWEKLLLQCRKAVDLSKPNTLHDFLFLGYLGRETNSAATKEYMIGELYPLFESNPQAFLKVLKSHPMVTESSCYYLGRHFGFEDQKKLTAQQFLKNHSNLIFNELPLKQAHACINILVENAR